MNVSWTEIGFQVHNLHLQRYSTTITNTYKKNHHDRARNHGKTP